MKDVRPNKEKFTVSARLRSFKHAFRGIMVLFKTQHNALIHIIAAIAILLLGFIFKISNNEWLFLIFSIGFVIAAEAFNASIEFLADMVCSEYHPDIRNIKDLGAAGVLIAAITSAIAGLIIFLPKIIELV